MGRDFEMPMLHESIADIPEKQLVERVLTDPHYRQTLFNIKGFMAGDSVVRQGVELTDLCEGVAGDVDILLIPRSAPEASIAIEVKRFKAKVTSDDVNTGHRERLREVFTKGLHQANKLASVGFSQVYLWLFIVVDSRAQNGGRYTYDGADSDVLARFEGAISVAQLIPRVGFMKFEWCQPMDRPPFELGTHGGHLERLATISAQPRELGERLRSLATR